MTGNLWDDCHRLAWRPAPKETIDQWAERCVVLPRIVSAIPGPIDLDLVPFIREPLRAATDREVREITLCCSTQIMKTTLLILIALHTLSEDPWNILHVMTTEDDAEDLSIERYHPIIQESPVLRRLLSGAKHDLCRDAIRLNGAVLTFRGAYSPAGLASRPVAKLFLDEVDKWPEWTGKEADPIKLAAERTATFWNSLVVDASTPTTERRYIWPRLLASTNERYHVPCPHCGSYQRLVMGDGKYGTGIHWPEEPAEIIQRDGLAWYECEHCRGRIEERHKPGMLRRGIWCPAAQKMLPDGTVSGPRPPRRHVGYHLWAAYSPWRSFSQIAGEFLRSKDARPALMNFRNSWQAEPWMEVVSELREAALLERKGSYLAGTVPEEAWLLTAGVDVQAPGGNVVLFYAVRAWANQERSWLVQCGQLQGWEALQNLFRGDFKTGEGRTYRVKRVMVDSGFRAEEVYEHCLRNGWIPTKGYERLAADTVRWSAVAHGAVKLPLLIFDTTELKHKLHSLIRADDLWWIPGNTQSAYFEHMTAEQLAYVKSRKTGKMIPAWRLVSEGRPNHLFDAEVLALVAAETLQIKRLSEPPREQAGPGEGRPRFSMPDGRPYLITERESP